MPEFPRKDFQLHVGWRTIKTAVSAMLVAIVYCLIGRNPAFACIGVIFGMGVDMRDSIQNGGNRLFGTLIGGLLSIGVFWVYLLFYPQGGHTVFQMCIRDSLKADGALALLIEVLVLEILVDLVDKGRADGVLRAAAVLEPGRVVVILQHLHLVGEAERLSLIHI